MRWLSRLVSILLIAAVVVGLGWLVRRKMPVTNVGQGFTTCAAFRDASKLQLGSPVLIAGVRVGEISNLSIEGETARIEMRLRDDTQVPLDSWVTKRAFSPFGDSYIEILPTGAEEGAATGQVLRPGQCLLHVAEGASTDRLLRVMERSMDPLDDGLARLDEVSAVGRKWAVGSLEESMLGADRWLDQGHIAAPLKKADDALARLESATTGAAATLHDATPDVLRTIDRIENGVVTTRRKMAGIEGDLREGFQNARDGMNGVDQTIDDYAEVVASVNENRATGSRGTLGKLINDPELANQIEDVTETARDGVAGFSQFQSWLGLRFEYNFLSQQPRFYVTAELRAHHDKFYLVELERGPLGDLPDDELSDVAGMTTYTRRMVIKDGIRFTAQFGKTFGWFQVRGGIKESTFGLGADVLLGRGRLRLSSDVYGGAFKTPRVKLAGALAVFRSAYLIAGVDDALNKSRELNILKGGGDVPTQFDKIRYGRDYFLGGMLQFDDADLAVLIRVYGALLVGLL